VSLALRRVAVALAAVALAIVTGPAPAGAAAAKAKIDLVVKNYTQAPGSSAQLWAWLFADRTIAVPRGAATILFQISGKVRGVSLGEAGHPNNCVQRPMGGPNALLCGPQVNTLGPGGADSGVVGYIGVDDTAVPGSVETITATFTVTGYRPVVRTAKIRVGATVDLKVAGGPGNVTAGPGDPFDARLTVRDNGSARIRGAAVLFLGPRGFESRAQFSNCWYYAGQVQACQFGQTLEPQTDYRVTLPFRVRADTFAPGGIYAGFQWLTSDEFADHAAFIKKGPHAPLGTPGKGGVLRLAAVTSAKAADPPQADPSDDNYADMSVTVTGTQGADLAAVGDRASGKVGATVTVSVGSHNNGPATIDHTPFGESPVGTLNVFIPKGTTAVRVPEECQPTGSTTGKPTPGAPSYQCQLGRLQIAGRSWTVDFGLRIDRAVTGSAATVLLTRLTADLDASNDSAKIVINPAGGSGSGSGGSGSGGSGSGSGGSGGGLPITGPPGAALGLAGTLLIVAGAGFLAVRRRRTRFEV
jgi:uncharacterized membrane protein YgcG